MHKSRSIVSSCVGSSESDTDEESTIENSHQRSPLAGYKYYDPPDMLGELLAGLHRLLMAKVLRWTIKRKKQVSIENCGERHPCRLNHRIIFVCTFAISEPPARLVP